jgi:hypothetical protein
MIPYNVCPLTLSTDDARLRPMAQAITSSNRSYNRSSERPPPISRQKAAHLAAFSRTYLNTLALTVFKCSSCIATRSSIVLLGIVKTRSFRCLHRKRSIEVISEHRGDHAISSRCAKKPTWICRAQPLPDISHPVRCNPVDMKSQPMPHRERHI